MPLGFPPHGFDSGLAYRAHPGDIFVCTYPKCGTTWMQYIVYLLLAGGRPLAAGRSIGGAFPHLEEVGRDIVEALAPPRLVKTHLPRRLTPFAPDARYVHVARNPFDCAVSFYHHTRGFPRHYDFADGTFDEFFECFIAGEVDFGDYFDHLVSWYSQPGESNVLFLTYEELKADTRECVIAVARFLGGAALQAAADAQTLARILDASSFERMREDQRRWSSERPRDMPAFVRKGVVGDWRSMMSPEQLRRLLDTWETRTAGTRAAALWPNIMSAVRSYLRTQ